MEGIMLTLLFKKKPYEWFICGLGQYGGVLEMLLNITLHVSQKIKIYPARNSSSGLRGHCQTCATFARSDSVLLTKKPK
jgi:hypothetical protein